MKRLTPNDAMFLFGESQETMMHVGSLMPFTAPKDAPPDFLRSIIDEVRATKALNPPWNLKLKSSWLKNPFPAWIEDPDMDVDYHARRSGLPSPGGERELGVLVSRLHAIPIDFTRPPWETHLIEGLEGGRFALYTKVHHALIDGYTANKMLARSFSTDPEEHTPLFFTLSHHFNRANAERPKRKASPWQTAWLSLRSQLDAAPEVVASLRELWAEFRNPSETSRILAPHSILNKRVGRNRRFATQQYDLDHIKALAKAAGGTLNDIVLALCSTALRRFLLDLNALPSEPLVAMLPVNVRPKNDPGGGNAVGTILATLATNLDSPLGRLDAIIADTTAAKERLSRMSKEAVIQLSALLMAPVGAQTVTGTLGRVRPRFNVCISNVPGPRHPLYFRGAKLEAVYPMSIPIHGQALNITCQSYNGTLNFGFTGCRDSLPHMQRLAVHAGDALAELTSLLLDKRTA